MATIALTHEMVMAGLRHWTAKSSTFFSKDQSRNFAGVFFNNLYTCLHGSQTSKKFKCKPPTLEEYLAMAA